MKDQGKKSPAAPTPKSPSTRKDDSGMKMPSKSGHPDMDSKSPQGSRQPGNRSK